MFCKGKQCSYELDFIEKRCKKGDAYIRYLQRHKCLPSTHVCPHCKMDCKLDLTDLHFKCQNSQKAASDGTTSGCAEYQYSAKTGTIFENKEESVEFVAMFVVYFFFIKPPHAPRHEFIMQNLECTQEVIDKWLAICREVIETYMLKNSKRIGGRDKYIEITEVDVFKTQKIAAQGNIAVAGISKDNTKEYFLFIGNDEGVKDKDQYLIKRLIPWIKAGSNLYACYSILDYDEFDMEEPPRKKTKISFTTSCFHPVTMGKPDLFDSLFWGTVTKEEARDATLTGLLSEFLFRRVFVQKKLLHLFWTAVSEQYPLPSCTNLVDVGAENKP